MKNTRSIKIALALIIISLLGFFIHKGFHLIADTDVRAEMVESGAVHYPPGTHNNLSYDLHSYDKGFTWLVFTNDVKGLPHVAGNADDLYPGLVDEIKGIKRLIAWNATHGPIDMKDPNTLEMLAEAGYVRHKTK